MCNQMTVSSVSCSLVRYGGSVKKMFWTCFSSDSLVAVCVIIVLLLVENLNWTPERHVLCVITSTFYLLLKTLGVLVKTPHI